MSPKTVHIILYSQSAVIDTRKSHVDTSLLSNPQTVHISSAVPTMSFLRLFFLSGIPSAESQRSVDPRQPPRLPWSVRTLPGVQAGCFVTAHTVLENSPPRSPYLTSVSRSVPPDPGDGLLEGTCKTLNKLRGELISL